MLKLLGLLKAPGGEDRTAFMQSVLALAPAVVQACPDIEELIVNLADVDPGDAEWVRPGEVRADRPTAPAYDAVIEIGGSEAAIANAADEVERLFRDRAGELGLIRTTPMPARIDRRRVPGRSPGVKYIVLCRFHADMAASAVQRSWAHHVPLALRVHVGADIYIRHWVDEILTTGTPPVEGVTELHFPTWEDMRSRWFVDEDGRRQIIQDIGHFLASGTRLYTTEHVQKIAAASEGMNPA